MLGGNDGVSDFLFFLNLGFVDGDFIGEKHGATVLSGGVVGKHDLHKDTHDTLFEEHVSDGFIDVVHTGLTGVHHISLLELDALGTLLLKFSTDNHGATSGTFHHDTTDDGVGGHTDGHLVEELDLAGLSLGGSAQALILDLDDIEFDGVLGVVETLLNQRGEFTDLTSINTQHFLGLGGLDTDFGLDGGLSDFNTGVTGSGQRLGQEGVEFGMEDTIGNEFLLLVDHTGGAGLGSH